MLVVATICLALGFLLGYSRSYYIHKRNLGEALVIEQIRKVAKMPFHLINNVTLPTQSGSTQIDHILVNRFGIFVIETKHYKGWIFGNMHSPRWTQVIYRFKTSFRNPILQNHGHILALRAIFTLPDEAFYNLVIFSGGAVFKSDLGPDVIVAAQIQSYLNEDREVIFDERKLAYIVGRIEMTRLSRSTETDEYHVNSLVRKLKNAAQQDAAANP